MRQTIQQEVKAFWLPHLKEFEGLKLYPYECSAGTPTIGYGHTKGVTLKSSRITESKALEYLEEDADQAIKEALQMSPTLKGWPKKLAAISDFIFNLGSANYRDSKLRGKILSLDWYGASFEMERWVHARNKQGVMLEVPGLVKRRKKVADWLVQGEDPEGTVRATVKKK